ncbi:TetR/AcrR family transcriptional repressor of nem operon [Paraburkholderia atlantica]|uniref:TetR/AcrR family transcriptional regulator n=1 Tax=Paraburkholderia atlantica TaxID=2654982 RepID=UPI003D22BB49
MPRPPNPEVRSRLLTCGRDVVLSLGFNGCGVADITEAAGVPKGSFYNYFESKEEFAAEILEAYWQSIEDRHGSILYDARVKPLSRIARFFHAISDDHGREDFTLGCLIGNLSLELSNASEQTRQRVSTLIRRWEEALAVCLREAQQRGELDKRRNADELAAMMVEAYEGAVMRGKIEQSGQACERFEKVMLPLLLA